MHSIAKPGGEDLSETESNQNGFLRISADFRQTSSRPHGPERRPLASPVGNTKQVRRRDLGVECCGGVLAANNNERRLLFAQLLSEIVHWGRYKYVTDCQVLKRIIAFLFGNATRIIAVLLVSVVQAPAIEAYIRVAQGRPRIVSWSLAALLALLPLGMLGAYATVRGWRWISHWPIVILLVPGAVGSILGATRVWGWDWWQAVPVFIGLLFLLGSVWWGKATRDSNRAIYGYCVLGFMQTVAIVACMNPQGVWHWVGVLSAAAVLGSIPVLGTAGAIYGAVDAWDWRWWQAFSAFTVLLVLWLLLLSPQKRLRIVAVYGNVLMGLLQAAAIHAYLSLSYDWSLVVTIPIAVTLGYVPVVGTTFALYSAVHALEWSWLQAVLVFVLPFVLFLVLVLTASGGRKYIIRKQFHHRVRTRVLSESWDDSFT